MTEIRETLPDHLARVCPDGAPPGLVPVRLCPVMVFGAEDGYGLMDAAEAWSDCNRARGHIYRRDEPEMNRRPHEAIVVWTTPEEAAKFDQVLGDQHEDEPEEVWEPENPIAAAIWREASEYAMKATESMLIWGTTTPPTNPAPPAFTGLLETLGGVTWGGGLADMAQAAFGAPSLLPEIEIPRQDLIAKFAAMRATPRDPAPPTTATRNARIGCEEYASGTWVHGDPHDCPKWARG